MKRLAIIDFDMTLFETFPGWVEGFPQIYLPLQSEKFQDEMDTNMKDVNLTDYIKKSCSSYLYKHSIPVISRLSEQYEVILMTFGHEGFQKMKVEASGISSLFSRVMYVADRKADVVKNEFCGKYDEILFINDNKTENLLMANINPEVVVVEIDHLSDNGYTLENFYESLE